MAPKRTMASPVAELLEPRTLLSALPVVSAQVLGNNIAVEGGADGDNLATLQVSRDVAGASKLTVKLSFVGHARNGRDYVRIPASVVIPANEASVQIPIVVLDDKLLEGAEDLILRIRPSLRTYQVIDSAAATATVNILDDERPILSIKATDPAAAEDGPATGYFTVSRTGPKAQALTVSFGVTGAATSGDDFQAINSIVIPSGAASVKVYVTPLPDQVVEGAETVVVTLNSSADATVGPNASATVTIVDHVRPVVTVKAGAAGTIEGSATPATFIVTRTGLKTDALAVSFLMGGTAVSGDDYVPITDIVIPAGASSVTMPVNSVVNHGVEGNLTVVLTLSESALEVVGAASIASVTIQDSDFDVLANFPMTGSATSNFAFITDQGSVGGTLTLSPNTSNGAEALLDLNTDGTLSWSVDPRFVRLYGYADDQGIFLTEFEEDVVDAYYDTVFDAPLQVLPAMMSIGQTFTSNGTSPDGDFAVQSQLLGMEIIHTPAGTFNCAKVQIQVLGSGTGWASNDTMTLWLSDGVVKWQQHSSEADAGVTAYDVTFTATQAS